ncbi:MAG: LEA type 2 family protein [Acidobacteriota bacterium]
MTRQLSAPLLLLLIALLLGSTGCASFGAVFDPPEVSLADLQIQDMTVFETTGRILVRITNPNPNPVLVEGGSYSLSINGVQVGRALTNSVVEVGGLESAVHEADLTLSNLALATRVASVVELEGFDYVIKAKLFLGQNLRRRVKVTNAGYFDFQKPLAGQPAATSP